MSWLRVAVFLAGVGLGSLLMTFRWEIYCWVSDRFGPIRLWAWARGKRLVWRHATDVGSWLGPTDVVGWSEPYGKWVEEPRVTLRDEALAEVSRAMETRGADEWLDRCWDPRR